MAEWINLSPWLLAILAVTIFLGAAFQHQFGIGLGTIASPVMLVVDHRLLPAVMIMLGVLSSLPHAATNLRKLNWSHCATATAGRLVGALIGAYLLVHVLGGTDSQAFDLVFAATLVLSVLVSTVGRWAKFFTPSVPKLTVASIISGVSGTMTAIGGPPFAIVYRLEPPSSARAHLSFFICSGALMSLAVLAYEGFVGVLQIKAAAVLSIPAVLGIWCSKLFSDVAHRNFKTGLLGVVVLAAVVIVIRSFE